MFLDQPAQTLNVVMDHFCLVHAHLYLWKCFFLYFTCIVDHYWYTLLHESTSQPCPHVSDFVINSFACLYVSSDGYFIHHTFVLKHCLWGIIPMSVIFCLSVLCYSTSCILPKIYVFCDVMPWLMVNSNILKGCSTIFRLKPVIHKFSKNSKNHLKFLYARRLTWRKFHTEYLQMCGAAVQNLVPGICAPPILQSEEVLLFGLYDTLYHQVLIKSQQNW